MTICLALPPGTPLPSRGTTIVVRDEHGAYRVKVRRVTKVEMRLPDGALWIALRGKRRASKEEEA